MLSNNGTTWRSNEEITESGSGALKTNPDGMKLDNENIHDLPGSVSIVRKIEELPQSNGGSVPMGGKIPQTDKNGMKIMGESGAGATGRDIND
jgi:hypothetical protein